VGPIAVRSPAGPAILSVPAGLKAGHPGWPKWLVAAAIPAIGITVDVLRPLPKARTDHLAARTQHRAEQQDKAQETLKRLPGRTGKTLLVREATDRGVLGIHEAIPLPDDALRKDAAGGELSADLPFYVTRIPPGAPNTTARSSPRPTPGPHAPIHGETSNGGAAAPDDSGTAAYLRKRATYRGGCGI
jgi:hypothetical protein